MRFSIILSIGLVLASPLCLSKSLPDNQSFNLPVAERSGEIAYEGIFNQTIGNVALELVEIRDDGSVLPIELGVLHSWLIVELSKERNFGLRFTNMNDERVMIALSVNRINPSNGKKAFQGQPGKVLKPKESWVLTRGFFDRKNQAGTILPFVEGLGEIAGAVFHESRKYPFDPTTSNPAPYGPENYRLVNGERWWIPPDGFRFRKRSDNPVGYYFVRYKY